MFARRSQPRRRALFGGGAPAISVTPSSWDFGSTPVGTPVTKQFTIQNTGTAPLVITLPITSDNAAFTITAQPASTSLAPGASTTFTAQFSGALVQAYSGNLSIVSNAASSPTVIAVTGTMTIITSGLVAWYDADDTSTLWQDSARTTPATADGDVIGAWDDKSGNSYHVIQATTADKPILKVANQNGKNAIRFDGLTDFLQKTSFADFGDAYTFYMVLRYSATADNSQGVFEVSNGGTVNTGLLLLLLSVPPVQARFRARDVAGSINAALTDLRDGTMRIHEGSNSNALLSYRTNGGTEATAVYTSPNPNTLNRLDIGKINNAGNFLDGDICEFILYSGLNSANEKLAMRTALNTKWAVY